MPGHDSRDQRPWMDLRHRHASAHLGVFLTGQGNRHSNTTLRSRISPLTDLEKRRRAIDVPTNLVKGERRPSIAQPEMTTPFQCFMTDPLCASRARIHRDKSEGRNRFSVTCGTGYRSGAAVTESPRFAPRPALLTPRDRLRRMGIPIATTKGDESVQRPARC